MTDLSILASLLAQLPDESDPLEIQEWLDALAAVIEREGMQRAEHLVSRLIEFGRRSGGRFHTQHTTPYRNTIDVGAQPPYPGDLALEERITAIHRWNALAMVMRANQRHPELGGHIATYASIADLFEVGFNHFFRATTADFAGDLVYYQPHAAPGVYARAFLEGRLTQEHLEHFRMEVSGRGLGLSSYPHPRLMPGFWQFPTGSMGLGPLNAIYNARFLRYLQHRGLMASQKRKVWAFVGDGEMDEPEALAGISLAAREKLDNLVLVVNCNLQRLDGPVRGNGNIVQELETLFAGAGWNVIKVLWGSNWDGLFARDHGGWILKRMAEAVDGEFQKLSATDGTYNREHFFNKYPQLAALVAPLSDREIDLLKRGGHDPVKIYAAYATAAAHRGQPTVILAKTMKGYGMGTAGQGSNAAHQLKKLSIESLQHFRERFGLPLSDEDLAEVRYYHPGADSHEVRYLMERRASLGGFVPARRSFASPGLVESSLATHGVAPAAVPELPTPLATAPASEFEAFAGDSGTRELSTTMVFVRLLSKLMRIPDLGPRVVPIVADEARTFGMQDMFRQVGIYSPWGQLYEPQDSDQLAFYREDLRGQILEEGITEAGSLASWIAAGTSYATNALPMVPFFIFYSMFGFQRVGDLIWAAADSQARGFLLGATAGRTTLSGEGLQHEDGQSHIYAATVPSCRAYDPAFGYEVAVIVEEGMRAMSDPAHSIFYYVTLYNENAQQPAMPPGAREGIVRGMHRVRGGGSGSAGSSASGGARASSGGGGGGKGKAAAKAQLRVQLLGSGSILREVLAAAELLEREHGVAADVWSVTSFGELRREGMEVERWNRLHPGAAPRRCWIEQCLASTTGPVVAATDFIRAYPDLIRTWIGRRYVTLGTDGFGRSDTRVALRDFFEVDRRHIALAALGSLADDGALPRAQVAEAMRKLGIDAERPASWTI